MLTRVENVITWTHLPKCMRPYLADFITITSSSLQLALKVSVWQISTGPARTERKQRNCVATFWVLMKHSFEVLCIVHPARAFIKFEKVEMIDEWIAAKNCILNLMIFQPASHSSRTCNYLRDNYTSFLPIRWLITCWKTAENIPLIKRSNISNPTIVLELNGTNPKGLKDTLFLCLHHKVEKNFTDGFEYITFEMSIHLLHVKLPL